MCLTSPGFGEWLTDFKQAKSLAAAEDKDLYLVFTGSDWSQSCQRFERDILSQEKFQKALAADYLLVRIDLPLRSNLPKEVKEAKRKLADRLVIESWPEAVYLDPKGRPFYREIGVLPLSPAKYAEHILTKRAEKKSRDTLFKKADQLEGVARAKAIIAALKTLPRGTVLEFYPDRVAVLERLDTEDSQEFLKACRSEQALHEIERSLPDLFNLRSFDQLIEKVDSYLKEHQPEGKTKQQALNYKMAAYQNSARRDQAIVLAKEIIEIDPKTNFGKSAARLIKKLEAPK